MSPLGVAILYVEIAPIRPSSCKVHRKGGVGNNKVSVEVIDGTELQSGVIRAVFNHSVLNFCFPVLLKVC